MKKGITLLEVLLSLAISNIMIVLILSMLLKYNTEYKNITKEYKDYFYLTEALMYIQKDILTSRDVSVENNKIKIISSDDINERYILLNEKNTLIVVDYKYGTYKGTNNLLKNLIEFNAGKKSNTIYVSLKLKDGEKYERCFRINSQP